MNSKSGDASNTKGMAWQEEKNHHKFVFADNFVALEKARYQLCRMLDSVMRHVRHRKMENQSRFKWLERWLDMRTWVEVFNAVHTQRHNAHTHGKKERKK